MVMVICQSAPVSKEGSSVTTIAKEDIPNKDSGYTKSLLGKEVQMNEDFVKASQPLISYFKGISRSIISGNAFSTSSKTLPMHSAVLEALKPVFNLFVKEIPSLVMEETQTNKKSVQNDGTCYGYNVCMNGHTGCQFHCVMQYPQCGYKHCD